MKKIKKVGIIISGFIILYILFSVGRLYLIHNGYISEHSGGSFKGDSVDIDFSKK